MNNYRAQEEESILVRLAAQYIAREANRNALITPIRAALSAKRTRATIYVSVFPDEAVSSALSFLQRRQHDFFEFLKQESRLSPIPGIRFEFDRGQENLRRVSEISFDS